eukprot:TRINITY_DN10599_c0_g1_i1.p1 TRINITY_DN10599_c0_g1~~TRINITY_DN10599_c0_g1_i1.p1  ORF type:complete len:1465 (+),score=233.12 TRINITY_DN10599_c0_g1_i1:45-4397(+)
MLLKIMITLLGVTMASGVRWRGQIAYSIPETESGKISPWITISSGVHQGVTLRDNTVAMRACALPSMAKMQKIDIKAAMPSRRAKTLQLEESELHNLQGNITSMYATLNNLPANHDERNAAASRLQKQLDNVSDRVNAIVKSGNLIHFEQRSANIQGFGVPGIPIPPVPIPPVPPVPNPIDILKDKINDIKNELNKVTKKVDDLAKQIPKLVDAAVKKTIQDAQNVVDKAYNDALDDFNAAAKASLDIVTCPRIIAAFDLYLAWDCPTNKTLSDKRILMCRDRECVFTPCGCWPGNAWAYDTQCDTPGTLRVYVSHRASSLASRIDVSGVLTIFCSPGFVFRKTSCVQCLNNIDCNGHAVSVTSYPDEDKCLCECEVGYVGEQCEACDNGYISVGSDCVFCDKTTSCSGNANYVIANKATNQCDCDCYQGYQPASTGHQSLSQLACRECMPPYVGKLCNIQCNDDYCHNRGRAYSAPAAAPLSDRTCECECYNWFTGSTCTVCPVEFSGLNCDSCAAVHVSDPPFCDTPRCTNCTFYNHTSNTMCKGCRRCSEADCSFNAKPGGITSNEDGSKCVCICDNQWKGEACDICPAQFNPADCGSCAAGRNQTTYPLCECDGQYQGVDCDHCQPKYDNATCTKCAANRDQSLFPVCPCMNFFKGEFCEICDPKYDQTLCDSCASNRDHKTKPICECRNNFYGENCDMCSVKFDQQTCSKCSTNRDESLYPACPCVGKFYGERCESCDPIYEQGECSSCGPNRSGYPKCSCINQYLEETNCLSCDARFNDTCNGCRSVPQNQYAKGCFACPDVSQVMKLSGICIPCPAGLICDGSMRTKVIPGWWRDTPYFCGGTCAELANEEQCQNGFCKWNTAQQTCLDKDTDNPVCGNLITPTRCYTPHCTGSVHLEQGSADPDEICTNGSSSQLCGVCGPGMVLSSGKCHECRSETVEAVLAMLTVMAAVCGSLGFVFTSFPKTIKKKPLFLRAIKQLLTHLQILATFAALNLPWGSLVNGLISSAESISAVGSNPGPFLCVFGRESTLEDTTMFWLFGVPCMVVMLALLATLIFGRETPRGDERRFSPENEVFKICDTCQQAWGEVQCGTCDAVKCKSCTRGCRMLDHATKEASVGDGARVLPQKKNVFINAVIVLYFLVWATILKELVKPLNCSTFTTRWGETQDVVTSDVRIQCSSTVYIMSLIGLLVHGVAVPVLLAVFLTIRKPVLNQFQWVSSMGFTYAEYRRNYCWWESVVILRKGLLIIAVAMGESTAVKVYSMVVIFVVFFMVNLTFRPYRETVQQHLESLSLVTLLGTVLAGEWVVHNRDDLTKNVLVVFVGVANMVYLTVWVFIVITSLNEPLRHKVLSLCDKGNRYADDTGSEGSMLEDEGDELSEAPLDGDIEVEQVPDEEMNELVDMNMTQSQSTAFSNFTASAMGKSVLEVNPHAKKSDVYTRHDV